MTFLGPQDQLQYVEFLDEKKETKEFPADAAISQITQLFALSGGFIGAWLVIDGPLVAKSSGREPGYRYWLFVGPEWECERFSTISDLYYFISSKIAVTMHYAPYYWDGKRFSLSGVAKLGTLSLDNFNKMAA